jgi:hypothetical protein
MQLKKVLADNSVPHDAAKLDKIFTDHGVTAP